MLQLRRGKEKLRQPCYLLVSRFGLDILRDILTDLASNHNARPSNMNECNRVTPSRNWAMPLDIHGYIPPYVGLRVCYESN